MKPPFEDDMNTLPLKVVMYDDKTPPRLTVYADNGRFYVLSTDRRHVFTILRRMVDATNLMPEAVEVIRDLIGIAAVLDYGADNAVTRAKQLLAKLEGGETA